MMKTVCQLSFSIGETQLKLKSFFPRRHITWKTTGEEYKEDEQKKAMLNKRA